MILPTYEHFAFIVLLLIVLISMCKFLIFRRSGAEYVVKTFSDRVYLVSVMVLIGYLVIGFWFAAIHDSQLSPHRITQSINGKVLNQFWVTNNTYVKYTEETSYSNGVASYYAVPHTNEYWHVWNCFKK